MDRSNLRIAIIGLCAVGGLCVAGIVVLEAMGRPAPATLHALGACCLGSVTGLLAGRTVAVK